MSDGKNDEKSLISMAMKTTIYEPGNATRYVISHLKSEDQRIFIWWASDTGGKSIKMNLDGSVGDSPGLKINTTYIAEKMNIGMGDATVMFTFIAGYVSGAFRD